MSKYFTFADAHSNWSAILSLLKQEGICGPDGKRIDYDTTVISLGDLSNSVRESREEDLIALNLVTHGIIDYLCWGNHDAPYLRVTDFMGFFWCPEVGEKIRQIELSGHAGYSYCIPQLNILLSHAGLTQEFDFASAAMAHDGICSAHPKDRIIEAVGRRRGGYGTGGILWSDWSESKNANFIQIIGHSVGDGIRAKNGKHNNHYLDPETLGKWFPIESAKGTAFCIDLGCNSTGWSPKDTLAGCWIDTETNEMKFVIYDN